MRLTWHTAWPRVLAGAHWWAVQLHGTRWEAPVLAKKNLPWEFVIGHSPSTLLYQLSATDSIWSTVLSFLKTCCSFGWVKRWFISCPVGCQPALMVLSARAYSCLGWREWQLGQPWGWRPGLDGPLSFKASGQHWSQAVDSRRDDPCLVLSHPALALKQNTLPLDFSRPSVAPNMQGKCSLRGYLSQEEMWATL